MCNVKASTTSISFCCHWIGSLRVGRFAAAATAAGATGERADMLFVVNYMYFLALRAVMVCNCPFST